MDAMSGRGELGDRGLGEDLYGLCGLGRIHDWVDSGGRGGLAVGAVGWSLSYSTGRTGRNIGLGGLGRTLGRTGQIDGLVDWRTGRTTESWTGRTGAEGQT